MPYVLESGEGHPFKQIVDRFGRAKTFATTTSQEHHAAQIEEAYMSSVNQGAFRTLTIPDAFVGPILAIKNLNNDRRMSLEVISASANAAGLFFYYTRNPTEGALGANAEIVPINLNFKSTKAPLALVHVWDESGVVGITGHTNGTEFGAVILGVGETDQDIKGAILLEASNILLLNVQNLTGGPIEFTLNSRLFFEGVNDRQ